MSRILVVDDDRASLLLIEKVLKHAGYEASCHLSPSSALEAFCLDTFDLILSDYYMPQMNGDQFLAEVRSRNQEIPFIFLTGNTDIQLAVALVKQGADDHITKPPIPENLLFRVQKNLKEREQQRLIRQVEEERKLMELENKQLANWRQLYAAKDITQTEQMVGLLSRTVNQAGGFMWLDLLESVVTPTDDGTGVVLGSELYTMILTAARAQRDIFQYITFIGELDKLELNLQRHPTQAVTQELFGFCRELFPHLTADSGRSLIEVPPRTALPGTVTLDREKMKDVLQELLINALKYSPEGSRVILEMGLAVSPETGQQILEIILQNDSKKSTTRDKSGQPIVGIPYDYSELVFDIFYTIEAFPVRSDQEKWGDGTGLYVARKLVKRHGGWISAGNGIDYTADPPRSFVRFTLKLPLSE
ncbi:Histidine kinase-, DNA gyrase B-, and HSP90-like ATPase [Alkalispirochaeta americana]|uniref:Histidine kinase-, DNA gyrase B-, and HSP90-like ATPase n=1 Tax=Alkalispirochaeta americana TaxID=159291 RepID=A0A1N6UUM9_9SPIO|nr:response regulator [Alkalispirochaeta americana]SIQ69328.1 Histidine kinase-, DNA gyrase B-, and HSP90-like ATPase [Alkalispirochaeta americana]